jgi:predicted MFS family arabinose efflux permease
MALVLLTALNFVNYIDRYILPSVQEMVKHEFALSDERVGALTTWFFITYIVAAPLTGWLGDRFPRKPLIVIGALLWSCMNLFTATVHSYDALLLRHAALGIGEASFGIYAQTVLADFYAPSQRNRVLTIFNLAIPVGAALGYILGGTLGGSHGWRAPFFVSAIPGILIAILVLFCMREPERGASEAMEPKLEKGVILSLLKNPAYVFSILGYAMVTFTMGGISWWLPSFLQRFHNETAASAGLTMGAITVATGIVGTTVGGIWAQRWSRTNPRALFYVSALSALIAVPFTLLCFFGSYAVTLPALAVAEFAIFLGTGPLNAAVVNSVSSRVRATALAGELFLIHALGDAPSPRIIGAVSDASNLRLGLAVTVIALLVAGGLLFFGSRFAKPMQTLDA